MEVDGNESLKRLKLIVTPQMGCNVQIKGNEILVFRDESKKKSEINIMLL